jgi:hypothetical protein
MFAFAFCKLIFVWCPWKHEYIQTSVLDLTIHAPSKDKLSLFETCYFVFTRKQININIMVYFVENVDNFISIVIIYYHKINIYTYIGEFFLFIKFLL